MGALKIDCYCNEFQMEKVIKMLSSHLYDSDRSEISDFDDAIDDIRVTAEFETYADSIAIKEALILDSDWDILHEDTAVLNSRLRSVLKDYNRNHKEIIYQAHHIINDRREQL